MCFGILGHPRGISGYGALEYARRALLLCSRAVGDALAAQNIHYPLQLIVH